MSFIRNLWNRALHKAAFFAPGGWSLRPALHRMRGVHLGKNVWISQQVYLDEIHPDKIHIGDNCTIGLRTSVFAHLYWGPRMESEETSGEVYIEDDVFIGPHCVILPNVRIGRGAVIKAGAVITRNVPSGVFYGPPPARPLARATVPLTPEHTYEEFLAGMKPMRAQSVKNDD